MFAMSPAIAKADTAIEIIDNIGEDIAISVDGNILHVSGANSQILYVYNLAGVRVMSIKVNGDDKRYELNLRKGCYIVKVGKTVRKISVR